MIDKNDVKMPVQKGNLKDLPTTTVKNIEQLLDMVNSTENNLELRLKNDYYKKFNWFGSRSEKSYFSYQEEAVYDFMFSLNKSGILSDQVGMGKTIEAGMIISELASRNEIRSLLIIVPNEIMAQKWEDELQSKFGIKSNPSVQSIKSVEDFYVKIFNSFLDEKFSAFSKAVKDKNGSVLKPKADASRDKENKSVIFKEFIHNSILTAVDLINKGFKENEVGNNLHVSFDGNRFELNGVGSCNYVYDAERQIERYVQPIAGNLSSFLSSMKFWTGYRNLLLKELYGLFALIGKFFSSQPELITSMAVNMTSYEAYPILVIPVSYSVYHGDQVEVVDFLNKPLLDSIDNYKHKYFALQADGNIEEKKEDYRIIDFFIDAGYQTLIVDEVHDYIDVFDKISRNKYHNDRNSFERFPSKDFNRFELFDEYFFIKKSSMYKKLKSLSDKANRKIFLTATPIKSDMVDFYLLTLIASNKDSNAYKKISKDLENAYSDSKKREKAIDELYTEFQTCIVQTSADYFCSNSNTFFAMEHEKDENAKVIKSSRCKYPYFNNEYLRNNVTNPTAVRNYLLSQLSYMTMEEMVVELVIAYNSEIPESANSGGGIKDVIKNIRTLLSYSEDMNITRDKLSLQTRVVFRALLNNTIKIRFEEDFTTDEGHPIKQIRELLSMDEGPRRWHKTYRKYGIRHTRHQTYNLSSSDKIGNLSEQKRDRYRNLPIWPKRNGKVIFLWRDDVFFDSLIDVKRTLQKKEEAPIKKEDMPNYERMKGSEIEKEERFRNAVSIFNYINDSMSGGDSENHMPQNSYYESFDIKDSNMVDYKLALVNKLMVNSDRMLGSISRKVLLFAENNRDEILEWFRYQRCALYDTDKPLDEKKLAEYKAKWDTYGVADRCDGWSVTSEANKLSTVEGNVLIIIDPKRYEKGVDLQKADTIINFDISYSPLKMEQRIGRIDRIRPDQSRNEINIISFVPFNDMSGFVINFFANELKMFTQWMGETTGIVSIPSEDNSNSNANAEEVSFEDRVYKIEEFYKFLYRLCRDDSVTDNEIESKAHAFLRRLGSVRGLTEAEILLDFNFIHKFYKLFDKIFSNSLSPRRLGDVVVTDRNKRVIRFNTALGILSRTACGAERCNDCPRKVECNRGNRKFNLFGEFRNGMQEFIDSGLKYYNNAKKERNDHLNKMRIGNVGNSDEDKLLIDINKRINDFRTFGSLIKDEFNKNSNTFSSNESFTLDLEYFDKALFAPVKKLFWDDVVYKYLSIILDEFHKQCDSVLSSAAMMERFIKILSIADFMNNMGGQN